MMWWLAMILACGEEEATEKVLANAPDRAQNFYAVPKVVD